jgi:TPP-dependent pyruvate/acetoin dehydrogenase alpha subunit
LKSAGIATEKDLEKIRDEVDKTVEESVEFAESSEDPAIQEMNDDIYKN